jgi:hypothetical protein
MSWLGKEDEYTNDALTVLWTMSAIPKETGGFYHVVPFAIQEKGYAPNVMIHDRMMSRNLISRLWFASVVSVDGTMVWQQYWSSNMKPKTLSTAN